ncbi:MAG: lipid-transfer protein [Acidimicrobiales bacterium]|nr:lipid-transfer protein [Acidimicrobiales bacterium]
MSGDWLAGKAAIVGIGHTAFGRRGEFAERGTFAMACEAVVTACADAGIDPSDVDGWSSYSDDAAAANQLAMTFGAKRFRYAAMAWGGGGSGICGAFLNAAMAVATGQADCVVVSRSICQGEGGRFGQALAGVGGGGLPAPFSFSSPYGLMSPAQMFALAARRHMHRFGTTVDHFGEIAVNTRRMASTNPAARFREPMTMADHHASRPIADPLRLFDCCMESDVAAACVLTSVDRAADLRRPPARVASATMGGPYRYGEGLLAGHQMADDDFASAGQRTVADDLWGKSGIRPGDVDAAMIYDHFTPMVLMGLEDFGFCAKGEGGAFVADGHIRLDGSLPLNTSGGNLSEVYSHGMTHVIEAVRQLRGDAVNQVPDAEVVLVGGGTGTSPTSALLLTR